MEEPRPNEEEVDPLPPPRRGDPVFDVEAGGAVLLVVVAGVVVVVVVRREDVTVDLRFLFSSTGFPRFSAEFDSGADRLITWFFAPSTPAAETSVCEQGPSHSQIGQEVLFSFGKFYRKDERSYRKSSSDASVRFHTDSNRRL